MMLLVMVLLLLMVMMMLLMRLSRHVILVIGIETVLALLVSFFLELAPFGAVSQASG